MSERERRIAENETRFREANEELRGEWEDMDLALSREALFICECGDISCKQVMRMTLTEYEAVRDDPNTFAVVLGHDDMATERIVTGEVVDRNDRFAVVEKRNEHRDVTEGTDPR